jgi:hypothetical protein
MTRISRRVETIISTSSYKRFFRATSRISRRVETANFAKSQIVSHGEEPPESQKGLKPYRHVALKGGAVNLLGQNLKKG